MASQPLPEPARAEPSAGRGGRIRIAWRAGQAWCSRAWSAIRPGPEARRGAVWGCVAAAAVAACIAGLYINLGWGLWLDFAFSFVAAAILIGLAALIVIIALTILRNLPLAATGFIVGACLPVALVFGRPELGIRMAAVIGLMEGLVGATIATFLFGNFRHVALARKIITVVLFLAAVAGNAALFMFLSRDGTLHEISTYRASGTPPPRIAASDPSAPGPYRVKTLTYGSGTDVRRPEYGSAVALKTGTVDASKFFRDFKGWRRNLRRRYWGFDMDKLPLNARVWYPDAPGPFPLALIVHGNHMMTEFSDPGYAYLGELLASRGFILASIDQNFLNVGLFHDPPKQQAVRGWLLLEHLTLWRAWKDEPGNPFHGKVDFEHIALMGHSRGGEAAATAALFNRLSHYPDNAAIQFDYGFPIRSVAAIAPADGQYRPAGQHRYLDDVSFFVIQGGWDADVASFMGSRQFDRVRYTHPGDGFKAELWIYRANHGQFNTVWGRSDAGPGPLAWMLNLKPLLDPEDQRRIAKVYLTAFLEATLRGRREYVPLFRDPRAGGAWLPDTVYLNRYEDASYRAIASFNEDPDVTTTTFANGRIAASGFSLWKEGRIPFRRGDRDYNGVFLGWKVRDGQAAPVYEVTLPAGAGLLGARSSLELSVAAMDEDPPADEQPAGENKKSEGAKKERAAPDFTVELQAGPAVARHPVTRFGLIPPPLRVNFTKLAKMDADIYNKPAEPVFQTVSVPLAAFPGIEPERVSAIRFRFDRTPESVIVISRIAVAER